MHPWTAAQLNSSYIRLLSRKNLGEKLLDRILPLFEVSEELTRFAGLLPLYVNSIREIFNHFHQQLERQKQEQFIIVLLDNKHRYLAEEDVTKGILNKSLVHPREVFASANVNIVLQL